jgi:hypothetical protein
VTWRPSLKRLGPIATEAAKVLGILLVLASVWALLGAIAWVALPAGVR